VKLSSKGRYGIRAIFDIAFHNHGEATQIKDIAERQAIPPRFLEQIFQDLKRAGLVTSKRGPKGGYALAKAPGEVRVGDVVRALEGEVRVGDTDDDPSACSRSSRSESSGASTP
jgi:Rrf2 family transcriptional regulator, iron-sulfur cluster assembly transcription factor